ncbi:DEAD/DEAH box helicase [Thermocrispum sp.]|uniref:DEAD/DEAH box helicase n=1 Tax=Thermocrispum sp. TaxID=2060768 RepID=UPI0025802DD5|nr:DEAD/DEAH box helicase [Thermocrispum sp.]
MAQQNFRTRARSSYGGAKPRRTGGNGRFRADDRAGSRDHQRQATAPEHAPRASKPRHRKHRPDRGDYRPQRPDRTTQRPTAHGHRPSTPGIDATALGKAGDNLTSSGTFESFALPAPLLRALHAQGIHAPFPIQAATLPDAIAGRDVLGRAQTGSGKTLAFGLALLARLHGGKAVPGRPRALVLVPTRELAMQVADALTPLAKATGLWVRTVVGGMSFDRQAQVLRRGVDLVIATPGRLADHVRQGTCALSQTAMVAVDEADRMADMGFLPQVREILDLTPASGQRLLFSATLDGAVGTLVGDYLTDPVEHSVAPVTASVGTMDHHVFQVAHTDKQAVAAAIGARPGRTILFVRTKHHADRVARQMRNVGVPAAALHGGKTQGQRNRVLAEFKDGRCSALVATDVAARGIHVDDVSLVVHVDPPNDAKDYLHRAGRTARAGAAGTVVTLMTPEQKHTVRRIAQQAGVRPAIIPVRPGDTELARITGAQHPSGVPLRDPADRRTSNRKAPQRRGRR